MKTNGKFYPVFEDLGEKLDASPLDIFRELARVYSEKGEIFFFRRSGEAGKSSHHEPTQTLIAIEPFETIRFRNGKALIKNINGAFEQDGDPFQILAQRMKHYQTDKLPDSPFFHGGALGYFAYDSIRHVETSLRTSPGNLRDLENGDDLDAEFGFFRKHIIFDHLRNRVLLMSGIISENETPDHRSIEESIARTKQEIEELRKLCISAKKLPPVAFETVRELAIEEMKPLLGKDRFIERVKKIKSHIRAGDIFQAVLSERFSIPFTGDSIDLFEILMKLSPSPYQFYFTAGTRVFMGASPEMLVRLSGDELETHPIAGTRPRGTTPDEEKRLEAQLKRSEKEKAEHLMLVDLARNDMGRVSKVGSVKVSAFMELKKFAGVIHLVSRVVGKIKESIHPVEALTSFFPAGTLSGAPKVRAMQILSELEPAPRGFYGGAVVIASLSGDLDSCIAIRSIQLEDGLAFVRAGAGVVADSRPESEYAEVQHKTRMARRALAIASSQNPTQARLT